MIVASGGSDEAPSGVSSLRANLVIGTVLPPLRLFFLP